MWHRSHTGGIGRSYRLTVCLIAALAGICLAGSPAHAQMFNVLHSFSGDDGATPITPLVQGSDGALYGITEGGGVGWQRYDTFGVIYRITTTGDFSVIHNFDYYTGEGSRGALAPGASGTLFGTTNVGILDVSALNGGFYSVSSDGAYDLLNSYAPAMGNFPNGGLLVAPDGSMYGTNVYGGANNTGTVFKVTPGGAYTDIYSFSASGATDGSNPVTPLTLGADGALYGVALSGGANGYGAIFRVTTSGAVSLFHSFQKSDGLTVPLVLTEPGPLVTDGQGMLYGALPTGGANGSGFIYRIAPDGTYSTIYNFSAVANWLNPVNVDGAEPTGVILGPDGALYGSAYTAGANAGGTLFRVTTAGLFTLLHTFSPSSDSNTDGINPLAGLMFASDGNLYGTASEYGVGAQGTVYQVVMPLLVKGLSLSPSTVVGGNTSTATVTLTKPAPAGGVNVSLKSSSKTAIPPTTITVAAGQNSGQGTIKTSAVSVAASATITASYSGSSASAVLKVIPPGLTGVALNPDTVIGSKSATATITLSGPAPVGGVVVALASSSGDATVPASVTVAAGKTSATATITTKRVTSDTAVTITASYASVSGKANLDITVQTFTVTPSAGSNGSISPNSAQTIDYGKSVSFMASPATGYLVNQWVLDGKAVSGAIGTTYKLSNVTANHTVKVTFQIQTFTITPSAGSNGSISLSTTQTIKYGGSATFKATPASGYKVNQWTLDGKTVQTGGSSYTVSNVKASHTVKVTFQ